MKTISEILKNYSDYETFLDDRFGVRLCEFLTVKQADKIGFKFKEGYVHTPKKWTEENVLAQLKEDVKFGFMKCCDERGISSELMANVVWSWCKVLENGLEDTPYGYYGRTTFETVAQHYGWELEE